MIILFCLLIHYRDALIVQLQQQVADLTLFLEEERLNHKATKEKVDLQIYWKDSFTQAEL